MIKGSQKINVWMTDNFIKNINNVFFLRLIRLIYFIITTNLLRILKWRGVKVHSKHALQSRKGVNCVQNGLKYIIETYRCQVMSKYQLYILVGIVMRTVMKKKTEEEERKKNWSRSHTSALGFHP